MSFNIGNHNGHSIFLDGFTLKYNNEKYYIPDWAKGKFDCFSPYPNYPEDIKYNMRAEKLAIKIIDWQIKNKRNTINYHI